MPNHWEAVDLKEGALTEDMVRETVPDWGAGTLWEMWKVVDGELTLYQVCQTFDDAEGKCRFHVIRHSSLVILDEFGIVTDNSQVMFPVSGI